MNFHSYQLGPTTPDPRAASVRALETSWRVRVSLGTEDANRCAGVVVSNWTLCQLYAVRRVKVENDITELKL